MSDEDLCLGGTVKDLTVWELAPELTSLTPMTRITSGAVRPGDVGTSTCCSLAKISSAE